VHYQRVNDKVNKGDSAAHSAFNAIGCAVVRAKCKEDVDTLFHVLCGEDPCPSMHDFGRFSRTNQL